MPSHFCSFRRFRGSEERSPCFQWVEGKFVIFAVFVKTAPFWQGTKTRFTKNTVCVCVCVTPTKLRVEEKQRYSRSFLLLTQPHWLGLQDHLVGILG